MSGGNASEDKERMLITGDNFAGEQARIVSCNLHGKGLAVCAMHDWEPRAGG